jgi:aspartyl-tRNA synthetase
MLRTRYAGSLRASDIGATETVCGWVAHRRDHGGIVFIDVRDVEGIVQVVLDPTVAGCEAAHQLRAEWVVRVTGEVRHRPEGTVNTDLPTGEVEIGATAVEVLNEAEPPPFPLDDRADIDEVLRLRFRYLDLRRPRMARNLRVRAAVVSAIRRSMDDQGFTDVTTPSLTRSTPEGARDFLVPSRLQPGTFFALPQSPQLFKQLLMVAGLDRYYQVAQCWRDEDLRADRQFEFVQLDAEMSFADADDVMVVIELAVGDAVEAITGARPVAFPRMSWHEAMARYGSDKPDTRFGHELMSLDTVFSATTFNAFKDKAVVGLRAPGLGDASRAQLDRWTDRAKQLGAAGLVWMRVQDGDLESPVAKFLSDDEKKALPASTGAEPGDLLLLVADPDVHRAQTVLGALRLDLFRPERLDTPLNFLWVVDFPLFEGVGADGKPQPAHHPFTRPHPDDVGMLESNPMQVRSLAYDLVVNGVEMGSGSVRIHDRELQERIFGLLGIGAEEAHARFGFLLDAFRYGAPPHAGFAFGVDRLAMILAGETSLRDVIAFPKTQSGADPLTGAPAPVDDVQLKDLGIRLAAPPPAKE